MKQATTTVTHQVGLHARPAATFVKRASEFESTVTIQNLTRDGEAMNAKSVVSVFKAAVASGHEVQVSADGPDEDIAVQSLIDLIASNFGE